MFNSNIFKKTLKLILVLPLLLLERVLNDTFHNEKHQIKFLTYKNCLTNVLHIVIRSFKNGYFSKH